MIVIFKQLIFGGLECVLATHMLMSPILYLDVWIRSFRIQKAAVASMRANNLATHLSKNLAKTVFMFVLKYTIIYFFLLLHLILFMSSIIPIG
jgi:hypothetical protein